MRLRLFRFLAAVICGMPALMLTGCFDDSDSISVKYAEWKKQNEAYIEEAKAMTNPDGSPYYTTLVPSWAPSAYSLVHWHNDRAATAMNLVPMDNSTVGITYELYNIEGKKISDSFTSPDSLYRSKPSDNIVGVWSTITNMHVGDSVTIVIPCAAGYGERNYGDILPYSTLVYGIKLKTVSAYEMP